MDTIDISHTEEIYTVSRLNREVRFLLEGTFPLLWVEGEISNFSAPHSGHWYFCLKDPLAQVKCAMFKLQNKRLGFILKDGMQVILKARISLYEGRGDYQLLVDSLEEVGSGKLQKEFEALKKKLSEAGLFAAQHKKPIPTFPKKIGVITSATGAAIRDILSVLKRRFCCAPIIIYPTLVQGAAAANNIVKAIQTANRRDECDVLILARGGGSIEDLWPFNEEIVAHAIFNSKIFIISGVGHEIDFTIADFVADVRAPTPSAAAELISPHIDELCDSLNNYKNLLIRLISQKLNVRKQELQWAQKHLQQFHPKRRLTEQYQRLDFFEVALVRLFNKKITALTANLENLKEKLLGKTPQHKIRELHYLFNAHQKHLQNLIFKKLQVYEKNIAEMAGKINSLSPLATLSRGYAIVTHGKKILTSAKQVDTGDKINVKLFEGELECVVD
jgi:exodeoxyribonuclease VII large subunit